MPFSLGASPPSATFLVNRHIEWCGRSLRVAYWWEQQLPARLRDAASRGDFEACLRYGEQLAALRWLAQDAPTEQAVCRRRQAELAWEAGDADKALQLQSQLVISEVGSETQRQGDRERLSRWRKQLQDRALEQFRAGDLDAALATLQPLELKGQRPGSQLSDSLRETWNRNRVDHERLKSKVKRQQWWEALSLLNQLIIPGGNPCAAPAPGGGAGDSESPGRAGTPQSWNPPAHTVDAERLNGAVEDRLASGMDPWSAFVQVAQIWRGSGGRRSREPLQGEAA